MRLAILVCGFMLLASPLFAQKTNTRRPVRPSKTTVRQSTPRTSAAAQLPSQSQGQDDAQLNRQVNSTRQRLQQEELRMQGKFAQLQKMRTVALEKQNQKELKRINQLEQQVVADYQKRVAQILINVETQIKATQIQVQASHDRSTKAKPTLASQGQRANKAQRASKARGQQQRRKSSQSTPQTSNSRTQWFGRW